ncbi:Fc.00g108680.m01.CDS01 [Cosmosporella sp. VM-42]
MVSNATRYLPGTNAEVDNDLLVHEPWMDDPNAVNALLEFDFDSLLNSHAQQPGFGADSSIGNAPDPEEAFQDVDSIANMSPEEASYQPQCDYPEQFLTNPSYTNIHPSYIPISASYPPPPGFQWDWALQLVPVANSASPGFPPSHPQNPQHRYPPPSNPTSGTIPPHMQRGVPRFAYSPTQQGALSYMPSPKQQKAPTSIPFAMQQRAPTSTPSPIQLPPRQLRRAQATPRRKRKAFESRSPPQPPQTTRICYDRAKIRARDPLCDPANFYANPWVEGLDWGRSAAGVEPMFEYTKDGQWNDALEWSAADLGFYILNCPRNLKLWVQHAPAQATHRMDRADKKCRWRNCPLPSKNIANPHYRVAFDEFPDETSDGRKNPFKYAGSVHLWCFEKCFDPATLTDYIRPDDRGDLPKEERNPMWLARDTDTTVVEEAYIPWFAANINKTPATFPRPHTETLAYALTMHHLKHQPAARDAIRKKRNKDRDENLVLTLDKMKGDLRLEVHIHELRKKHNKGELIDFDQVFADWDFSAAPERLPDEGLQNAIHLLESVPEDQAEDAQRTVLDAHGEPVDLNSFNVSPGNNGWENFNPNANIDHNLPIEDHYDLITNIDPNLQIEDQAQPNGVPLVSQVDIPEVTTAPQPQPTGAPIQSILHLPGASPPKASAPPAPSQFHLPGVSPMPQTQPAGLTTSIPSQSAHVAQSPAPVQSPTNKRKRSGSGDATQSPQSPKRHCLRSAQATGNASPSQSPTNKRKRSADGDATNQSPQSPKRQLRSQSGQTSPIPEEHSHIMGDFMAEIVGEVSESSLFGDSPQPSPLTPKQLRLSISGLNPKTPRTPKRTSLTELRSPENVRRNPMRSSRSSQGSRKSRTSI